MKGRTEIILTDVNTGEVEKIVSDNMLTNALHYVFNRPPHFFNNLLSAMQKTTDQAEAQLTPVYNHALGGVLLFPEPITEDANIIYAPADNQPVAIGSNDGYTGTDARRGSYNSIDSGEIREEGTNKFLGYRYVWDFPTSAGNGRISCICLTSVLGGAGYLDSNNVLLHKKLWNSNEGTVGLIRSNYNDPWASDSNEHPRGFVFGATQEGIIFRRDNGTVCINRANLNRPRLLDDPDKYETLFSIATNGAMAVVGDDVWVVRTNGNASGTATINIDKYIAADGWSMTTETITAAAPLKRTEYNYTVAIIGDYLYMCGYGDNGVYKINLANVADVKKIEVSVPSSCLYSFGDLVSSRECFIDQADGVHITGLPAAPCYRYGAWAIISQPVHGTKICFFSSTVFMPYLATINNTNPVLKDSTKTMRVIYSIYED